ncbi:MAG: rod shape-determining protein MreC [Acidimicrobiia bacterium]
MLILLVLTSITLITLDTRGGDSGVGGRIRNTARDVFSPIQDGVDAGLRPIEDWWDGVTRAGDIKDENKKLRRELQAARGRATAAGAALRENAELKRLAKLTFVGDLASVDAEIILGSPGNFESTVALNRGSDVGIAPNQPVVSGVGLLGRVARVSAKQSTVLLLTDRDSGVSVRDVRTGQRGVINGKPDSEQQTLENIDGPGDVKFGDELITAGTTDGPYPPGIAVARVTAVRTRPGDLVPRVTVKLHADAATTEFVRVLQWPIP